MHIPTLLYVLPNEKILDFTQILFTLLKILISEKFEYTSYWTMEAAAGGQIKSEKMNFSSFLESSAFC